MAIFQVNGSVINALTRARIRALQNYAVQAWAALSAIGVSWAAPGHMTSGAFA